MTITMEERIYRNEDDASSISAKARRVVSTAAKFAEMVNTAFWEDRGGDCIVVYEGPDGPTAADTIPCSEIGKTAEAWALETFDWCAEMPDEAEIGEPSLIDESTGDYTKFAHRDVTIQIEDLIFYGGIRLEAFDRDGCKISGIAFVPSKRKMDAELAAITKDEPRTQHKRGERKPKPRPSRRAR